MLDNAVLLASTLATSIMLDLTQVLLHCCHYCHYHHPSQIAQLVTLIINCCPKTEIIITTMDSALL